MESGKVGWCGLHNLVTLVKLLSLPNYLTNPIETSREWTWKEFHTLIYIVCMFMIVSMCVYVWWYDTFCTTTWIDATVGYLRTPYHLVYLAKYSLASGSYYWKAPIHIHDYQSIGLEVFMPLRDGLYAIGTRYKIQHGNIDSTLEDLYSLLEGCDYGTTNLWKVGIIRARGDLKASTASAYICNNVSLGQMVQRIHMVLQMMSWRCVGRMTDNVDWLTFEKPFPKLPNRLPP